MNELYPTIGPAVYLLTILATLTWAGWGILRQPRVLLIYTRAEGALVAAGVAAMAVLSGIGFALAALAGQIAEPVLMANLVFSGVVALVVSTAVFPAAMRAQRPIFPSPWPLRQWFEIGAWTFGALAWSAVSITIITRFVDWEITKGGIADVLSTKRLWEYLGFSFFALIMAVVEEVIFRGGLQGSLENTRLGRPGAIILAAALFALGHVGYMEPHGIKETQIFGLAVIFGVVKVRFGLLAAILIHIANNAVALAGQFLMGDMPVS